MTTPVRKDLLYPGTVHPPNLGQPVTFTKELLTDGYDAAKGISVPFLHQRMRDMLAAGLQIPLAWEHQASMVPMTAAEADRLKAEKVKLHCGFASKSSLTPASVLCGEFDVADETDRATLKKVKYISPWIKWNHRDGGGRLWPGPSCLHFAATPQPVQHAQASFQMSLLQALETDGIRLSLTDYTHPPIALGDSDMAEKVVPPDPPEGEGEGESGGLGKKLKKLCELVESMKMHLGDIGDSTTIEDLVDRLIITLETKKAHEGGPAEEEVAPEAPETPTDVAAPGGIGMSMAQVNELRAQAARGHAAEKRAVKYGMAELEGEIKALGKSGRVNKPIQDAMLLELKSVKLSLSDAGDLVADTDLLSRIKIYKGLPAGAYFPPAVRLSMESTDTPHDVPRPRDEHRTATGELSEERVAAVLEEIYPPAKNGSR